MDAKPVTLTSDNATEAARVLKALLEPFAEDDIRLKPAQVKGNRCLALAYISARCVMDRLDEVVGINNWRDEYTVFPNGEVECRLSVRIAGEWITKADAGGQSDQPDEGDRLKSAYSDGLKRAAVKFGIGRFLYRRPQQWMDYDPVKKCIVRPGAAQPAKAVPPGKPQTVTDWGRNFVKQIEAAPSRDQGTKLWGIFDADVKANKVNAADKALIDAAFKAFGQKFPKAAAAGTK